MSPAGSPEVLTVVIPALDEEEAIGDTIQRCLDARPWIESAAGLEGVEIIVVSDGSTDGTARIARSFPDVRVVVFEENRGYGAAIKEGWRRGRGGLLGFLDADGTCDPLYFAEMCRELRQEGADVVLGSRLGPGSKMPRTRRAGNRLYALLLGFLCGRHITDTASGMRVVRREALRYLYPLPDGLHFTPSMSARALLNGLRIVELPMRYEERLGRSKLSLIQDGLRFLRAIVSGVLCYRPERFFLWGFGFCAFLMALLGAGPAEFYLRNGRVEEWMIFRFMACFLLGAVGLLLLLATALAYRMSFFSRRRPEAYRFWPSVVTSVFRGPGQVSLFALSVATALIVLWPGIAEYVSTGGLGLHWSRLLVGAFCLLIASQTVVFAILLRVVAIWREQHVGQARSGEAEAAPGPEPNDPRTLAGIAGT